MDSDRIEHEVVIEAPVERVWTLVTDPEHFAAWYAFGGAEIDLRLGGALLMRWDEHGSFHGVVERVEPPHAFAYRYAVVPDEQPGPGNSTLVELTLAAEGDKTRVRVVETGFAALDRTPDQRLAAARESEEGWHGGFVALRDHANAPAGS